MLCRFSLPHKQQLLGLPAGMCIKVKAGQLEQAFNPISTDETPGEVVILVKVRAQQPQNRHVSNSTLTAQEGSSLGALSTAAALRESNS